MNEKKIDLFELRLADEGAGYLLKTFTITRWLFILAIVGSLVSIALLIIKYFFLRTIDATGSWMLFVEKNILPFIFCIQLAGLYIQLYLYFRFVKQCRQSILLNDTELFNRSFRSFFQSTIFALAQMSINLVITCMYVIIYLQLVGK